MELDVVRLWLTEKVWLWLPLLVLLMLILCHLAALWQNKGRSRAILAGFDDSTRGRVVLLRPVAQGGFVGRIEPSPEPFTHFLVIYHPASSLDPLDRLLRPTRQDRLEIHARLVQRPFQELQWRRGEFPGRAVGKVPGVALWTIRRLDITQSDYATRGPNTGALIHVFTDIQSRFEPLLYEFSILAEREPQLIGALRGDALNLEKIPSLVTLVRAAGRAALLA